MIKIVRPGGEILIVDPATYFSLQNWDYKPVFAVPGASRSVGQFALAHPDARLLGWATTTGTVSIAMPGGLTITSATAPDRGSATVGIGEIIRYGSRVYARVMAGTVPAPGGGVVDTGAREADAGIQPTLRSSGSIAQYRGLVFAPKRSNPFSGMLPGAEVPQVNQFAAHIYSDYAYASPWPVATNGDALSSGRRLHFKVSTVGGVIVAKPSNPFGVPSNAELWFVGSVEDQLVFGGRIFGADTPGLKSLNVKVATYAEVKANPLALWAGMLTTHRPLENKTWSINGRLFWRWTVPPLPQPVAGVLDAIESGNVKLVERGLPWWGPIEMSVRAGLAVRRSGWLAAGQASRSVVGSAGAGTARAVAVTQTGSVVTPSDFGASDFTATDWQMATGVMSDTIASGRPVMMDVTDWMFVGGTMAWVSGYSLVSGGGSTTGPGTTPTDPTTGTPITGDPGSSGFLFRKSDGTTILVPGADCSGTTYAP